MRTTLNLPENIIKEAEALYETQNRSKAVEYALKDAIRFKKLQVLKGLKGKISFDEEAIDKIRGSELYES